jgi:hypothetical protein
MVRLLRKLKIVNILIYIKAFLNTHIKFSYSSTSKWYPRVLAVPDVSNHKVITILDDLYLKSQKFSYAEVGVYEGQTSMHVARLFPKAKISLFDFSDRLQELKVKFRDFENDVNYYPNSYKYLDSYNWSLVKLLEKKSTSFDFVYLDGAHTFAIDGLTFFLIDMLLERGGHIYFDDYNWTLRDSSLDPKKLRITNRMYTPEQIESCQLKLVIDLLVKTNKNYIEIIPNALFKKIS